MTDKISRRKCLGLIGGGIGLTTVPSVAAARGQTPSRNGHDTQNSAIGLENGKLTLSSSASNGEKAFSSQAHAENPPADPDKRVTPSEIRQSGVIDELNTLKEDGHMEFSRHDGEPYVEITDKFRDEYDIPQGEDGIGIPENGFSAMHHGENGYAYDIEWWGTNQYFKIDAQAAHRVYELAVGGAAVSAAAAAVIQIASGGTATVPAAALAILTALLSATAGLISGSNDGHGVVIKVHALWTGPGYWEVDGQFEDDNGWPL